MCEEPKEEDYEELHLVLSRDDLVEDATPIQQAPSLTALTAEQSQIEIVFEQKT
jgi:hypothetical protein